MLSEVVLALLEHTQGIDKPSPGCQAPQGAASQGSLYLCMFCDHRYTDPPSIFKVQFKTSENFPPSYSSLMSLNEVKFLFPFYKLVIPSFLSRLILFYKLLASRSYSRVTLLCDQNINQRELPVCVLIYTIQPVSPFPYFLLSASYPSQTSSKSLYWVLYLTKKQ